MTNIDVKEERWESVCPCVWRRKRGKNLFILLPIPPTFVLFCFGPFFFKTCCFCGWSAQSFSQIKQGGKKAHGDGEAALCRLNGAIVRHGGGEGDGS